MRVSEFTVRSRRIFLPAPGDLNIGASNILMTHGAQMAIFIAARLILKPGATVLVGEPNYYMADMIFQQFGRISTVFL